MKTIYTTHPVDPEVKAEIRSKGGKIIDARFAPEGAPIVNGQTGDEMSAGSDERTVEAIEKMKKADLVAAHVGLGADPAQTEAKTVAVLREELIAAVTANE